MNLENIKTYEGKLIDNNFKIGIIVSRFNEMITSKLLNGCIDGLARHNVKNSNIEIVWVPGSFEIPSTTKKLVNLKKFDAIICLGAVIRGETPHFDYVSAEVSKGIAQISLNSEIPIVFGVLTTDSVEQSMDRAGVKLGNKGFEAAMTAIEMIDLYKQLK